MSAAIRKGRARRRPVRGQVRALYALCAFLLAAGMYDTATSGLWYPESLTYLAASLTGLREWLSIGYLACAAGMLPFMAAQMRPTGARHRTMLLLCVSCLSATLLWVGEMFTDRHTNLEPISAQYLRYALGAALFAVVVASNFNACKLRATRLRKSHDDKRGSNRVPLK